jgi:hypothetical protein
MSRNERERQARRLREAKAATTTPEHNDVPALSGLLIQAPSVNGGDTSAPAQTQQEIPLRPQEIDHFVLNLPDSALTFLDAFRGCCAPLLGQPGYDRTKAKMAMVHVYCFTRELEPAKAEQDICAVSGLWTWGMILDSWLWAPVRYTSSSLASCGPGYARHTRVRKAVSLIPEFAMPPSHSLL